MNKIEKLFLPQNPPGAPVSLATSVGDMIFLRTENGGYIPHPTEDNPIRMGFVGDRPTFTSVDYYTPEAPTKFRIDGSSPDSRPMEFDADGLCIAPEVARGCFRRDGDDLLMIDDAVLERIRPKRLLSIVAVGKSEDYDPIICGISVPVDDEPRIDRPVSELPSNKKRYYFVSCVFSSADGRRTVGSDGLLCMAVGGLKAVRECLLRGRDWAEGVRIVSLTPLSEEEYEFLKGEGE